MPEQPNSAELVKTVKDKNRRLMQATIVFMALSGIALIIIVLVGLNNLSRANEQLAAQEKLLTQQGELLREQKRTSEQGIKNTNEQLSKVSRQIDCIAQFFTQQNRSSIVITDLEQCSILNPDGTVTTPSDNSVNTDQGGNASGTGDNPQPAQPSNPGSSGSNGNGNNGNAPTPPAEQPPVEVLGIPVCVPLTNVCVRQ